VVQRRRSSKAARKRARAQNEARDEALLAQTGIRVLRERPVFTTPNVYPPPPFEPVESEDGSEVLEPRHCYVCKQPYHELHPFYDQLCPPCGTFNHAKRSETADLEGRVALLTGGRVKIGYQAAIKLLRAGCAVIVTTRFPRDAAARFAREDDFGGWASRLEVFGLDLRHTPSVEAFCAHLLAERPRLDFVLNNACQTVRRPPAFYAHMLEGERAAERDLDDGARQVLGAYAGAHALELVGAREALPGLSRPAELSQLPLLAEDATTAHLFPDGLLDQDLQQVDLRDRNSWRLLLADVSTVELLETQLVNAVAPFVLNARLKPLLQRTPERDKHVVNVSAVEGQFYRRFKTTRHPHTNMAKAALNMMTRTSAADYHADGIHMNSVDTGGSRTRTRRTWRRRRRRSTGSARRSTSWTAPPGSWIRSSTASTPARTCGASSSRTTGPRTGEPRSKRDESQSTRPQGRMNAGACPFPTLVAGAADAYL